jgi:hypothetical protein
VICKDLELCKCLIKKLSGFPQLEDPFGIQERVHIAVECSEREAQVTTMTQRKVLSGGSGDFCYPQQEHRLDSPTGIKTTRTKRILETPW